MRPLPIFLLVGFAQARNDTVVKGWVPEPNGRGTWSILWSSLATVFICTWSVLHLDVRKRSRWRSILRKCQWMLSTVLIPEYILASSVQHFLNARTCLPFLVRYGGPEWTMTHAQFASDEGFEISYADGRSEAPDIAKIVELMARGEISQPPISADELHSRGESNWLVKLIALLQISWFAFQTLFRVIQHIQVTPLEVLVLAFVFCSILTYILFWSKPQNVGYTVSIPLKSKTSSSTTAALTHSDEEIKDQREGTKSTSTSTLLQNYDCTEADGRGSPRAIDGLKCDSSRSSRQLVQLPDSTKLRDSCMIMTVLMALFGAVHCLAWNSPFPSSAEELTWRVCALIITSIPALLAGTLACFSRDDGEKFIDNGGTIGISVAFAIFSAVGLYAAARIGLIVLAFTALRAQPSDAYQTVTWTQYLPNFTA